MSRYLKTIFIAVAVTLVTGYLVVMSVLPREAGKAEVKCHTVECRFSDSAVHQYISAGQVRKYLHQVGHYPVGRTLDAIALQSIEDTLAAHPIIATANCYMGADGTMYIELTQRTPILHVVTGKQNYFVATDRQPMPVWSTIRDTVLEAGGQLSMEQACGEVADFAQWLKGDSVWSARVARIELPQAHQYILYLRGDSTEYILGDLNNYETQLRRLSVFDSQRANLPETHYGQVDLRFDNQVVTRP